MNDYRPVIRWLLVFIWVLVILFFSSQPNLQSGLDPLSEFIAGNGAHAAEYFVLTFLLLRALRSPRALWLAAGLTLLAALGDELYQQHIAGRQSSLYDVLADLSGILTLVLLQLPYGKNLPHQ